MSDKVLGGPLREYEGLLTGWPRRTIEPIVKPIAESIVEPIAQPVGGAAGLTGRGP